MKTDQSIGHRAVLLVKNKPRMALRKSDSLDTKRLAPTDALVWSFFTNLHFRTKKSRCDDQLRYHIHYYAGLCFMESFSFYSGSNIYFPYD